MLYFSLKLVVQLLTLGLGVTNAYKVSTTSETGAKKKLNWTGRFTIALFVAAFLVFFGSEYTQKNTVDELRTVNHNLLVMRADHDLAGIEISFKPSTEQWSRIAAKFNKIKSDAGDEFPYRAAPMTAERTDGGWVFDFGPIENNPKGWVRPAPVLPGNEKSKAFKQVIHEALIPLWIKWCCGIETEIEPWRDNYPSAIKVSQEKITFTLRPPLLRLNVNSLNSDPMITLRSRAGNESLPISLTFRSLDSVIVLDQKIDLNWKEERDSGEGDTYTKRTKPFSSGPYKLLMKFRET